MTLPSIKQLRAWRERLEITQKRAALAVGIKQPYLARIEGGSSDPGYSLICKLVSFYELVEQTPKETIAPYVKSPIVFVDSQASVSEAVRKMRKGAYSQLPVFLDGRSVGSIGEAIVCNLELKMGKERALNSKIEAVMGPIFPELDINAPLDMAREMVSKTELILVRKEGKIVGAITKSDLI